MEEEQKLMENVLAQFQKTSSDSSGGAVLAHALSKFADICAAGLQEWKEHNAYINADPYLCQRYDDLVLQAWIRELERQVVQLPNKNCNKSNNNNGSIKYGIIEPEDEEEEEYDDEEDNAAFAEAQANRPAPLSESNLNNNQMQVNTQLTMDYVLYQNDAASIVL